MLITPTLQFTYIILMITNGMSAYTNLLNEMFLQTMNERQRHLYSSLFFSLASVYFVHFLPYFLRVKNKRLYARMWFLCQNPNYQQFNPFFLWVALLISGIFAFQGSMVLGAFHFFFLERAFYNHIIILEIMNTMAEF